MSKGGGSTTVQNNNPWAAATPYLTNIMQRADTLSNNTGLFTPQYSADTQGAASALGQMRTLPSFGAGAIQNTVGQTNGGLTSGMGALQATANGNFLNGNPYLDSVLGKSMQDTADRVNAQFSGAGRYGSGAQTSALTRELGGLETNARMQNYQTERQNQLTAANSLGALGMQGANMAQNVDQLNAQQLGYGLLGGQMQDQMALAQQQAPLNALQYASNIVTPIGRNGSQGSSTTSNNPSTLGMLAGALPMALAFL